MSDDSDSDSDILVPWGPASDTWPYTMDLNFQVTSHCMGLPSPDVNSVKLWFSQSATQAQANDRTAGAWPGQRLPVAGQQPVPKAYRK